MMPATERLVITETHPVQYHAPVYRETCLQHKVPLHVVYGGDFSISGHRDVEFGVKVAWSPNLIEGVPHTVLSCSDNGGPKNYGEVTTEGLAEKLKQLAPRAVLALGYSHRFDRAALSWARSTKTSLFFRGETSDVSTPRPLWLRLARDIRLRLLYRHCQALLYVGSNARSHYRRLGVPDERLFFSPYCVDEENFQLSDADRLQLRHETRAELDIPLDATVLMFSGKLSWRKGVDLIPDATCELPENLRAGMRLLFVGDGELRSSLEAACLQKTGHPGIFTGFQSQSSLSRFYHAADIFVLPSRVMETWGLVVNEALLHGLPCVVSNRVGCQPDLVLPGTTGAVSEPDDSGRLALAIQRAAALLGDPNLRRTCQSLVKQYSTHNAALGLAQAWRAITCRP